MRVDDGISGFPSATPVDSYWQLPPHPIANHRTTESLPTSTFDYVIIGSGVMGAAIAHQLLARYPSCTVLMLEARTAASGASGRNGGHCRPSWWLSFKRHVAHFGEDEALKIERLEEGNVRDVADFVRTNNVDCDFQAVESANVYIQQDRWNAVMDVIRVRDQVWRKNSESRPQVINKVWQGQEAREEFGIPSIVGVVTTKAYTQNPYLLVCKMLELCLDKGLNLQTNTLATNIIPGQEAKWHVETDRGLVCGEHIILATNAYTNALYPELARTGFLVPRRVQVTAVRPGTLIPHHHLQRSYGLNDIGLGDYFMTCKPGSRGEGDIIYGGGAILSPQDTGMTDDSDNNTEVAEYLHHAGRDTFGPEVWGDEGKVVRDWVGITCYTPDMFPLVGEAPGQEGLWLCAGMNGHGMALAFRCAEALVITMTTGSEPDWFPKSFRVERAFEERTAPIRLGPLLQGDKATQEPIN